MVPFEVSNLNANGIEVPLQMQRRRKPEKLELTDEELLLASPVLWGFSLSDKLWRERVPSSLYAFVVSS